MQAAGAHAGPWPEPGRPPGAPAGAQGGAPCARPGSAPAARPQMFPLDLANVLQAEDITVCSRNQKVLPGCERCLTTTALSPPQPSPACRTGPRWTCLGEGPLGPLSVSQELSLRARSPRPKLPRLYSRVCSGGASPHGMSKKRRAWGSLPAQGSRSTVGSRGSGENAPFRRGHAPVSGCVGPPRVLAPRPCAGVQGLSALPERRGHEGTPSDRKVLNPFLVPVSLPISVCSPVVLENQD